MNASPVPTRCQARFRRVDGMTAEWPTLHHLFYAARCSNRGGGDGTKPNEPRVPSRVGIRDSGRVVVLGSIEARYTDELARLEQSHTSGWAKERLRQQLESRRKSAREPHVLKLAELRQRLLAETLWRGGTWH